MVEKKESKIEEFLEEEILLCNRTGIIKFPKLIVLFITLVLAIILFSKGRNYEPLNNILISLGYFGTFIGGLFYSYGFSAAIATAVLLILAKSQNLFLAIFIGGVGAVISDFLIFYLVRHSLDDEVICFKETKFMRKLRRTTKKTLGKFYTMFNLIVAGILISSPLPTELGIAMIASMKKISAKKFLLITYILHTIGIAIILLIGNSV